MKKMKIAMIVSAIVVVVGLALSLLGLLMMRFDFRRLELSHYQSKTYEFVEDFNSIVIDVDTADIDFRLSQDGVCRVTCFEDEHKAHTVTVQNGVLQIQTAKAEWHHNISLFNFSEPTVTVSLPKVAYDALELGTDTGDVTLPSELSFTNATVACDTGDVSWQSAVAETLSVTTDTGEIAIAGVSPKKLSVKDHTGDISVSDGRIEALEVSTHTGEVKLSSIECGMLTVESDTGDVKLQSLLASGAVSITTDTGDVDLDACDAATLTVRTNTGDVWGILLSEKVFVTKTDTGDVDVPKGTSGGVCEVVTDTGDIELSIRVGS
ncbi:MAG: DUF4097 family beta strand repeat protein [Clostridia bacterium]|nr:DUF4097 family beta strand repeat protein [Clostridia bacterium]